MIDDAITQPLATLLLLIVGLGGVCSIACLLLEVWRLKSRVGALEAWRNRSTTSRYRGSPYRESPLIHARTPLEGAIADCDGCPNDFGVVECEMCQSRRRPT